MIRRNEYSNKVLNKKKLEIIRKLLDHIKKDEGDSFQFFLSYSDKNEGKDDFNCFHSNQEDFFKLNSWYIDMLKHEHVIQKRYEEMANNNEGYIVCCINEDNVSNDLVPIKRGLFYNVSKIVIRNGKVFYELEGQVKNFKQLEFNTSFYSSERFVKMSSFITYN